ncbi:phosphoribosylamine--glycine ligase [Gloeobacter morelensis]|uniref:Phosphoribosylamine--glycine ligase n=1 Tax=Gloeobacter morelensis MG652769 TaxID=2781736 RepID=A0ABY3PP29_9CYAN|nr:phosphoribosylamine--glycine ligase [Gloeobacter morelensis]UFP95309.1 phosphoribosylamine--glycine ligase [Gloeobacter morelensis MG652769]
MALKILVVGNGGREHCLAWALARSEGVGRIWVAPGNGGTADEPKCANLAVSPLDFAALADFARSERVDLTVVGPEVPLAAGIVDHFQAAGLIIFGPTREGAQLEASKAWAKNLMHEAGVPTAAARSFTDIEAARAYVRELGAPLVVKADGLAAGKGVSVAMETAEALAALDELPRFGAAGASVLIEEFMAGEEASVLAFTDGKTIRAMVPAQDHKRVGEGDTGPNTGGMGAYAPTPLVDAALMRQIEERILAPTFTTLQKRGIDYRGVLYAGLMIGPDGSVRVVEFNCRLGDPETQVVLPLLETPLEEVLLATAQGSLDRVDLQWKPGAAACVVLAAAGYPGDYRQGDVITGLAEARAQGGLVFHSGTRREEDKILTAGGRILAVTALGDALESAIASAYQAVDCLAFKDVYYRRDIGWRALLARR